MDSKSISSLVQSQIDARIVDIAKSMNLTSSDGRKFPPVTILPEHQKLRILVTGGAGFVGSHLVDKLMLAGHTVYVVDNYFTGRQGNVEQWVGHPNFQIIIHDVVESIYLEVNPNPNLILIRIPTPSLIRCFNLMI